MYHYFRLKLPSIWCTYYQHARVYLQAFYPNSSSFFPTLYLFPFLLCYFLSLLPSSTQHLLPFCLLRLFLFSIFTLQSILILFLGLYPFLIPFSFSCIFHTSSLSYLEPFQFTSRITPLAKLQHWLNGWITNVKSHRNWNSYSKSFLLKTSSFFLFNWLSFHFIFQTLLLITAFSTQIIENLN